MASREWPDTVNRDGLRARRVMKFKGLKKRDMVKWFKEKISSSIIGILKRVHRNDLPSVDPEPVPITGKIGGVRFFLGTKTGLMYYDGDTLWRLHSGRVYGITKWQGRWYTTWNHQVTLGEKPLGSVASIISFRFDEGQVTELRVEAAMLDEEVHQIDAYSERLYLTDTGYNRVIEYQIKEPSQRLVKHGVHYPNGMLQDGKDSPNYAHINSVFRKGASIYLMYHNHTKYSGRPSQIARLNEEWGLQEIIETSGDSAHNVCVDEGELVFCDSRGGQLVKGGETYWESNVYLRGLAATEHYWLVGGSAFAERGDRDETPGYVYLIDKNTAETENIMRIPDCGSLYEVRITSEPDFCMSSESENIGKASVA